MPTITIDSLIPDMVVDFDYHPSERQTRHEPGCDACVDINAITVQGVDVADLVAALNGWKRVEELVLQAVEEQMQEAKDDTEIDRYEWSKST